MTTLQRSVVTILFLSALVFLFSVSERAFDKRKENSPVREGRAPSGQERTVWKKEEENHNHRSHNYNHGPPLLSLVSLLEDLHFISQLLFCRITFKQTDIDWPSCINYIEFDYYDTVYNESVFMETLRSPLEETIEFQIVNQNAPCDPDFAHFTRVYGATGDFSKGFWTQK